MNRLEVLNPHENHGVLEPTSYSEPGSHNVWTDVHHRGVSVVVIGALQLENVTTTASNIVCRGSTFQRALTIRRQVA